MRKAIPNPCIGPMAWSVFSTSKSRVPCKTSLLEDAIHSHSFRRSTGVYHCSVERQQESGDCNTGRFSFGTARDLGPQVQILFELSDPAEREPRSRVVFASVPESKGIPVFTQRK